MHLPGLSCRPSPTWPAPTSPCLSWAEEWAPFTHGKMVRQGDHWGSDHNSAGETQGLGRRWWGEGVETQHWKPWLNHKEKNVSGEKLPPRKVLLCCLQNDLLNTWQVLLNTFETTRSGSQWREAPTDPAPLFCPGGRPASLPAEQSGLLPTDSWLSSRET